MSLNTLYRLIWDIKFYGFGGQNEGVEKEVVIYIMIICVNILCLKCSFCLRVQYEQQKKNSEMSKFYWCGCFNFNPNTPKHETKL